VLGCWCAGKATGRQLGAGVLVRREGDRKTVNYNLSLGYHAISPVHLFMIYIVLEICPRVNWI
jgi:hypothetical protein